MMLRSLLTLALVATPTALLAQASGGTPPQRIRNIQLQPGEKCPASTSDEVVVCGTADREQYRIPKAMRDEPKQTPANTAWAVRADRVMDDQRRVLPGSCSPIGSNGQTGCSIKAAETWAAEKRAAANGVVEPQ